MMSKRPFLSTNIIVLLSLLILINKFSLNQAFNPNLPLLQKSSLFIPLISRTTIICHSKAGSFFNPVPPDNDDDEDNKSSTNENLENDQMSSISGDGDSFDFDRNLSDVLKKRSTSLASEPSTISGVPTSKGFGTSESKKPKSTPSNTNTNTNNKPYVGLGKPDKPLNDITNPESDDQGYTLYTDEKTGEKKRVFEALVSYPCKFKIKVIGANEGCFVEEIVQVVADSCNVVVDSVDYSERKHGKWISITVNAPVENAEMLYSLYENIDRDPRVKFKF